MDFDDFCLAVRQLKGHITEMYFSGAKSVIQEYIQLYYTIPLYQIGIFLIKEIFAVYIGN